MVYSLTRIGCLGTLALIAGCMAAEERAPGADRSRQEIASDMDRFFSLTRDVRRCAAPLCGGYHARPLNAGTPDEYVSALSFKEANLDDATVAMIQAADPREIVIRGHLGPPDPMWQTKELVVVEAYRGLPGLLPRTADAFYAVSKHVPPIECITTPCPYRTASTLNTGDQTDIDTVSFDELEGQLVQRSWLDGEIMRRGGLVAGDLTPPSTQPGTQRLVLAHQVYLRLPARQTPCRPTRRTCGDQLATFTRNDNRCLMFDRCVDRHPCDHLLPTCPEGYTLKSWAAAPDGCPAYACDPLFSTSSGN